MMIRLSSKEKMTKLPNDLIPEMGNVPLFHYDGIFKAYLLSLMLRAVGMIVRYELLEGSNDG